MTEEEKLAEEYLKKHNYTSNDYHSVVFFWKEI